MMPQADIKKKAEEAFEGIWKAIIAWQPTEGKDTGKTIYPAKRFKVPGTDADINSYFLEKQWSLGLPIIPPTSERVAKMLKGTSRKPDEVVGQVPPKMGSLTVELVAVHAVMAGCKPEYMPVLIAALEGFLDSEADWRGSLTTTGTTQSIVILNGPIVKELRFGYGQGAAGKGYHANGAIGYAINLIGYSVGGSRPPMLDRSTLASPSDYVCWVFGENEDALPQGWEPLHVDRGFKKSDNVVTVLCTYPPIENIDHWSTTVEEHMRWWRYTATPMHNIGGPCHAMVMNANPIVAVGPEHAGLLASGGWSKSDFARSFWENVRIPLSAWPSGCVDRKVLEQVSDKLTGDTLIPVTLKPEQFLVMVAGGDGKHSHYFAPFPGCYPVSKLISK
jgi:hypothetical protein